MTIKEFQKQTIDALSEYGITCHILESDNSLLVNCGDESSFLINILESKLTFVHNECNDAYVNEYLAAHTDIDFAQDLLSTSKIHPTFFLFFMIFTKLKKLNIVNQSIFYHIMDNVIYHEKELNEFISEMLTRYANRK